MREYRLKNLEKFQAIERERARQRRASGYKDDPEKIKHRNSRRSPQVLNELSRQRRQEITLQTFAAYGNKCSCCSESNPIFLTIDHINNDGSKERKAMGNRSGIHLYRSLYKRGFPKEGYRLMCFNCNLGRARNGGICPHEVQ